jgi:hypothetical protein
MLVCGNGEAEEFSIVNHHVLLGDAFPLILIMNQLLSYLELLLDELHYKELVRSLVYSTVCTTTVVRMLPKQTSVVNSHVFLPYGSLARTNLCGCKRG